MCGITGFYNISSFPREEHSRHLNKMLAKIHHRGPNDTGVWFEDSFALGFKRLSILDLSPTGSQPMISKCSRFVIGFNGEIYNFKELRKELEKHSESLWAGHSDTEVLLAAIVSWGIDKALSRLNGMFAFALWDRQNKLLTLARDRFGEKPIYYSSTKYAMVFGSELTSLEAFPKFDYKLDKEALSQYFNCGYFPAPHTVYKSAKKLLPAHYIQWSPDKGFICNRSYWNPEKIACSGQKSILEISDTEAISHLDSLLKDAVSLRMSADVPLGALLSGGVDSSTVVALMQSQSNRSVRSFSLGFDSKKYNEAEYAKSVAKHLETNHTEHYISASDLVGIVPKLGSIYDEPFADRSQIPTFLISQITKQYVTVCLSGDGGDELFGGYSRYQQIPKIWEKLSLFPGRRFAKTLIDHMPLSILNVAADVAGLYINRKLRRRLTGARIVDNSYLLAANDSFDLYKILMTNSSNNKMQSLILNANDSHDESKDTHLKFQDFLHTMMYHDTLNYLPGDILTKVDRATMAVSLEGRMPLLDHRIFEFVWQLPANMKLRQHEGKWLLKQVLYKYVPKSLMDRPKMGFSVPLDEWLRNDLSDWAESLLSKDLLQRQGILNSSIVQKKWQYHRSGKADFSDFLWPVLMFQSWLEQRNGKCL